MIEYTLVMGMKKVFDMAKDTKLISTNNVISIKVTGEELKLVKHQFPNLRTNNGNSFLILDGENMRFVVNNLELPKLS